MQDPTPRTLLERVGAWELGRTLGRGAYAHVRAAKHTRTGHEAACKILPALHRDPDRAISQDELMDAVEAHKEVVLLKGLNGAKVPGIAGLEGVIEQGGWTYVFLTIYPYAASKFSVPMDLGLLRPFCRKLWVSLHALHELDISHEDLKRANVLVDNNGDPVLVDFGFSHFNPHGYLVKSLGGTLDYSSPQKAKVGSHRTKIDREESRYDARANDVWSMGILLTKFLGLPHPYADFTQDDTSERLRQRIILDEPLIHFTKQQAELGVRKLLRGMLTVQPEERWTIPQILESRFLRTHPSSQSTFVAPTTKIGIHTVNILENHIIQDLCFLSYLIGEHYLCETDLKIREKLRGKEPCWEKRWAKMLSKWTQKEEMQWEDVPVPIKPKHVSVRSKRAPLREIKVDNKADEVPAKRASPAKTLTPARATYQKSVPPLARKVGIFSPKRPVKKVSTMPLSVALQKMDSLVSHLTQVEPELARGKDQTADGADERTVAEEYSPPSVYETLRNSVDFPDAFLPEPSPVPHLPQRPIIASPEAAEVTVTNMKVKARIAGNRAEPRITRARALALLKEEEDWPSDQATVGSRASST